jgi:two-component system cell cycle response regulator CpdR
LSFPTARGCDADTAPRVGTTGFCPKTACFRRSIVRKPNDPAKGKFAFTRNLPPFGQIEGRGPSSFTDVTTSAMHHKILLAEDDNDMRRFLVKALENAGFQVSSFDNGLSAYQRLREEPFEMLLTDIVMPEMDGIELARRASELDPDIKIMFITGFAAVALNSDSEAPKNAKVLSKPVHLRELVSEVNKMLAA